MVHAPNTVRRTPSTIVLAAFSIKLAKHLALLVCLAIVGQASGRVTLEQSTLLAMVVTAAAIHGLGRALNRRSSIHDRAAP